MADSGIKYNPFFLFVLAAFLLVITPAYAQVSTAPKAGWEPEDAEEHFKHTNYLMALPIYKELLKREPKQVEYNYRAAICYLQTNINKALSVPHLELITKIPGAKLENDVWFQLGRAYQYALRFDDAIKAYEKFKESAKGKDIQKAERQIEMCHNGQQLIKFPVNVTFENAGSEINTTFPDYYPLVTKDESQLVFTTRRKEAGGASVEFDGYYPSDIYFSPVKDGKWSKATMLPKYINTRYDEQAVGMSSDGKQLIVYLDHIDSFGNIYVSKFNKEKASYSRCVRLDENVNEGLERTGSISPDGEIIFFASDRKEGLGMTDLYMCKKLPNGKWAKAQSLGPNINTPYKEDFPFLTEDGKTFYFSSEGHSSMGDYDLFKAVWDPEANTWSKPVNLGYPVNTPEENRCISFTENNRVAYVSALRPGSYGDLDIYRVLFNESDQRFAVFNGFIFTSDSSKADLNVIITATDVKTKKEFTFVPAKHNGRYVMALTPGTYALTIEAPGYKDYIDAVVVYDMGSFQPETAKNYTLVKQ